MARSHYPMPDDAEPMSAEIWDEPALPDGQTQREQRLSMHTRLAELALGTPEQRARGVRLPFYRLPQEDVDAMSPRIRAIYEYDLTVANDPRSGSAVTDIPGYTY